MNYIKKIFFILGVLTFLSFVNACSGNEHAEQKNPIVIFDTDLGNDVDDILALQMLLNYEKQNKVNLAGVTIGKSNPYSFIYTDAYNCFNKMENIPIGYVYEGPNKDDGKYLKQTLDSIIDGKKILQPRLSVTDSLPEAYVLQRKLLSGQEDNSVIFIAVGPVTNLQRLVESAPDKYSELNGIELIQKKVNLLVIMGGNYDTPERSFPEWNIVQDIDAAKVLFAKWPTKIVASGFEIGRRILYPHASILNDLSESYKHPLAVSYKLFEEMPYDRETWDLTAVLYAINQNAGYFDISQSGEITIDEEGNSIFSPNEKGKHHYLSVSESQIPIVLEALIQAVTNKWQ